MSAHPPGNTPHVVARAEEPLEITPGNGLSKRFTWMVVLTSALGLLRGLSAFELLQFTNSWWWNLFVIVPCACLATVYGLMMMFRRQPGIYTGYVTRMDKPQGQWLISDDTMLRIAFTVFWIWLPMMAIVSLPAFVSPFVFLLMILSIVMCVIVSEAAVAYWLNVSRKGILVLILVALAAIFAPGQTKQIIMKLKFDEGVREVTATADEKRYQRKLNQLTLVNNRIDCLERVVEDRTGQPAQCNLTPDQKKNVLYLPDLSTPEQASADLVDMRNRAEYLKKETHRNTLDSIGAVIPKISRHNLGLLLILGGAGLFMFWKKKEEEH